MKLEIGRIISFCEILKAILIFRGLFKPTFFLKFLFLALFFLRSNIIFSQGTDFSYPISFSEKIFLNTDRSIYLNNQTLWVNAIVTIASDHSPSQISGVLYIELIDFNEIIRDRKIVKLDNGLGQAFFDLSKTYLPGKYLVRAYTRWNENFGENFIAQMYVDVYPSQEINESDLIYDLILKEEEDGSRNLEAIFDPMSIDSLVSGKLDVFVTIDGLVDSLSIKPKDQIHKLSYPISPGDKVVSLRMRTENGISYSKTVILKEGVSEVKFYPESGSLVHGIFSRVAFQAKDVGGKGVKIKGDVIDEEGNLVTSFESTERGIGNFLIKGDTTKTFFAEIPLENKEDDLFIAQLPKTKAEGDVLFTYKTNEELRLDISSSYRLNDSSFVSLSCRGEDYFFARGILSEGKMFLKFSLDYIPEGVSSIKLFDKERNVLANRYIFNHKPQNRLKIIANTDSISYCQRQLTKLNIAVVDSEGHKSDAILSVKVLDEQLYTLYKKKQLDLIARILLFSDFKYSMANDGFLLRPENALELDTWLMTQTASEYKFHYTEVDGKVSPENSLGVSGRVDGSFFRKKAKEGIEVTLMTFGDQVGVFQEQTDSLGRFNFMLPDMFGAELNALVQTVNEKGEKKDYSVILDEKVGPPISFDQRETIKSLDSLKQNVIKKEKEKNSVDMAFNLTDNFIQMEEFTVEDYFMTPQRKEVMDRFGKPTSVLGGSEIESKEEKWSYGLYSILLFNYPGLVSVERRGSISQGFLYAKVHGGGLTLVVVDGVPVMNYDYYLIQNIQPSEVKSFEIIKNAKGFSKLFLEVFPLANPLEAPQVGSVIAIYTHAGRGLFGANPSEGVIKMSLPVFSAMRDYEQMDYSDLTKEKLIKPDLRSLLFWKNNIEFSKSDQAQKEVSYYNSDITGKIFIILEALTPYGHVGIKEMEYTVKNR